MKRIISFIGAIMLTAMPLFANIAEGVSGDCTWVIDNDGNLEISSEKEDAVLGSWEGDSAPWNNYRDQITTVVFSTYVRAQTCTHMFSGCTNLNSVYLDNFFTNDVTDMSYMFANCTSLENLEFGLTISSIDDGMSCAKGLFLSYYRDNFRTSNATNMAGMFENCKSLHYFGFHNLDINKVMDFSNMFAGCSSLEYMELTGLTVHKDAKVTDMFANCDKLMEFNNEWVFPSELEDETFKSLPTRGICSVGLPLDCFEDYASAKGWRYLFIASADSDSKMLGQQTTTGIGNMTAVDDSKPVFTFAGERVSAPVKGLNIIDGKKVMVK